MGGCLEWCEGGELTQDGVQWLGFMNTVMNLKEVNFLTG